MDNIPSPFSTLDDDDGDNDDDLNFNSKFQEKSQGELYTIKTKFNPLKDRNVKVKYTNETCDSFTKNERKFAMNATQCDSLEGVSQKVSDSLLLLNNSHMKVFLA